MQKTGFRLWIDTSIRSDYTKISSTEYLARCTVVERGSTIVEVADNVPSEEDAIEHANVLKKKAKRSIAFYSAQWQRIKNAK